MPHNHAKSSVKRQNKNTKYVGKFILYVEGRNTESSYFDLLKKTNCRIEPVSKKGNGIGQCVDFVDTAINKFNHLSIKEKEKYKQKWLVFDFDGRNDFQTAIVKARKLGFHVAFSSMCIEYWFILHFQDQDGSPIPKFGDSHSQAQINILNNHIKKYNKKAKIPIKLYDCGSKIVEEDFFDLLMATDPNTHESRILSAMKRAKEIHVNKRDNGAEFNESVTNIYELLIELGVFVQKNKEWTLYCR